MNRSRTILLSSVVLVAIAIAALGVYLVARAVTDSGDDGFTAPEPAKASAPADLEAFYGQKVSFTDCGDAQCAWVKVPIDYAKPEGGSTRIRMKVYPSEGGKATRSLFVNPGGPGGSALDFADTMHSTFSDKILSTFDVVGVDPRGVGESSPLTCLPAKKFDAFTQEDPDPDDAAEITALRTSLTDLGEACLKNSGDLAAHVSTVEAAKDMDVVRALLGRSKLDWFGASYGTELGAVYAQLFPKTVGRMVLDGAVDPSLDAVESSFAQATGFQRAITAYAEDCAQQSDCPIGTDPKAGVAKVADLLQQLDSKPLRAGNGRELTEGNAFYGIAVTLYDEKTWQYLTQGLDAAFQGDGSVLQALSDAYFERQQDGSYQTNGGQVIYAVGCLDSSPSDALTLKETEAQVPRFEKASPVFGSALAWGALGCTDWPIKSTNPLPTIDGKGAPPIVVIGTTRDPATPYESAEALASQLESAVLLTRDGDGHTAYLSGNQCIVKAVDGYLLGGKAPAQGTVCT